MRKDGGRNWQIERGNQEEYEGSQRHRYWKEGRDEGDSGYTDGSNPLIEIQSGALFESEARIEAVSAFL